MEKKYLLLDERKLELPSIYNLRLDLMNKYDENNVLSRRDVINALGGEYLKDILNEIKFTGDIQKGLDDLIKDLLVSISNDGSILDNMEFCPLYKNKTCERTEKSKSEFKGRKSCDKKDYSIDCMKLEIRKNN
jgi:hypothetical protein